MAARKIIYRKILHLFCAIGAATLSARATFAQQTYYWSPSAGGMGTGTGGMGGGTSSSTPIWNASFPSNWYQNNFGFPQQAFGYPDYSSTAVFTSQSYYAPNYKPTCYVTATVHPDQIIVAGGTTLSIYGSTSVTPPTIPGFPTFPGGGINNSGTGQIQAGSVNFGTSADEYTQVLVDTFSQFAVTNQFNIFGGATLQNSTISAGTFAFISGDGQNTLNISTTDFSANSFSATSGFAQGTIAFNTSTITVNGAANFTTRQDQPSRLNVLLEGSGFAFPPVFLGDPTIFSAQSFTLAPQNGGTIEFTVGNLSTLSVANTSGGPAVPPVATIGSGSDNGTAHLLIQSSGAASFDTMLNIAGGGFVELNGGTLAVHGINYLSDGAFGWASGTLQLFGTDAATLAIGGPASPGTPLSGNDVTLSANHALLTTGAVKIADTAGATLTVDGGYLQATGTGTNQAVQVGVGSNSAGALVITNGGTVELLNLDLVVGDRNNANHSLLRVDANSVLTTDKNITISGGSQVALHGGRITASHLLGAAPQFGNLDWTTGTLELTTQPVTAAQGGLLSDFLLGPDFTLDADKTLIASSLLVGGLGGQTDAASASLTIVGGSLRVIGGYASLGVPQFGQTNKSGTMTVRDRGNATFVGTHVYVGDARDASSGTLNVLAGGIVDLTAQDVSSNFGSLDIDSTGVVNLNGGSVRTVNQIFVKPGGTFNWTAGTLAYERDVILPADDFLADGTIGTNKVLEAAGTLAISSNLSLETGGQIIGAGVFAVGGHRDATLIYNGGTFAPANVIVGYTSTGTLEINAATTSAIGSLQVGRQFQSTNQFLSGSVIVNSGAILNVGSAGVGFSGTGAVAGNAVVNPGSTLWIKPGAALYHSLTHGPGFTIDTFTPGTITVNTGGTLLLQGLYNAGQNTTINIAGGDADLADHQTFGGTSLPQFVNNGHVTLRGKAPGDTGGYFRVSHAYGSTGSFDLERNTILQLFDATLGTGVTFNTLPGDPAVTSPAFLSLQGTYYGRSPNFTGNVNVPTNSTLHIDGSNGQPFPNANVTIDGQIVIDNVLKLKPAEALAGSGKYTGSIDARNPNVFIAPGHSPGQLVVDGDEINDANTTFKFELGGDPTDAANAGVTFDQLVVTGTGHTLTVGGAMLQLVPLSGVQLNVAYPILKATNGATIDFSQSFVDASNGLSYQIGYDPAGQYVNVTVTPEPAALGLIGVGALLVRRRRAR